MAESKNPKGYIKNKSKIGSSVGFNTSSFFRNKGFRAGGVKSGFNPASFKTQHKG